IDVTSLPMKADALVEGCDRPLVPPGPEQRTPQAVKVECGAMPFHEALRQFDQPARLALRARAKRTPRHKRQDFLVVAAVAETGEDFPATLAEVLRSPGGQLTQHQLIPDSAVRPRLMRGEGEVVRCIDPPPLPGG